ncbi:hypothetical protein GGI15_001676 [Coemansia interrupta]|uniref:BZIP domain-containing protein n=1 Tax=Coemansia interrupta TaxID=1126814 RepID=A0A9W8HKP0_9FUNG|nr:hypothetical protein GGI15_001676 [Coemansia interrupta]
MSTSEQHAYAGRFASNQAPASAWGARDVHYRQRPMALPTPSPHAGYQPQQQQQSQQHSQAGQVAQKAGGWGGIAGYMAGGAPPLLPPPGSYSYSRSTTVSPPAGMAPYSARPVSASSSLQAQHPGNGASPYALPPLSAPITPVHPPSPPACGATAKPATAKRRRKEQQQQRNASASPAPRSASGKRSASSSPPPPAESEAARILEERRRRNASASARFRKRRNERERELLSRCMFLEQQLLGSVGARAFDEIMRKAPAAQGLDAGVGARRGVAGSASVGRSAASSRAPSPRDDSDAEQCAGMSVSALMAPRSVDDVWAAYVALSQQVAGAVQRIDVLESAAK